MPASCPLGVTAAKVAVVTDANYYSAVRAIVERSSETCWGSIFIVDVNPHHDEEARVLQVLKAMRDASWRGVSTRLLIGGSREQLAIDEATFVARSVARTLGIDVRLLSHSSDEKGSHVKLVIADEFVLSGSHNWSRGALGGQTQDSLLIESPALAAAMRTSFQGQWQRAQEEAD